MEVLLKMEKKQKINCTVSSCKFNHGDSQKCMLEQIVVTPMEDVNTKQPDESMCSSYEYNKN